MAKKSVIARNRKRKIRAERMEKARAVLRKIIRTAPEERDEAVIKLQKRPRNESLIRVRNRCRDCGRSRGVYRKFG